MSIIWGNCSEITLKQIDFDVDKAYTMMYEVNDDGLIATTSPLAQFDSYESLLESFILLNPDNSLIIDYDSLENWYSIDKNGNRLLTQQNNPDGYDLNNVAILPNHLNAEDTPLIFKNLFDKYNILWESPAVMGMMLYSDSWSLLSKLVDLLDPITKIHFYNDLLTVLKEFSNGKQLVFVQEYIYNKGNTNTETNNNLMEAIDQFENPQLFIDLNKHNSLKQRYNLAGLKNKVMSGMWKIATDLHNLEAATQPMEMKPVTRLISEYVKEYKPELFNKIYTYLSPVSKWEIQYENSVGKQDVGIAANAVKAAGSIQQRHNLLFKQAIETGIIPDEVKLNLRIVLNYKGRSIYDRQFLKWANVVCTDELFDQLTEDKDFTTDLDYKIIDGLDVNVHKSYRDEVLSSWNLFSKLYNVSSATNDSYKQFLKFNLNFENNAADYLSIFISLATD